LENPVSLLLPLCKYQFIVTLADDDRIAFRKISRKDFHSQGILKFPLDRPL